MYYIYIHNCLPSSIDLMLLLYTFEKNNVLYQSLHFMMFIKSKSRSRRLSQHAQLPIVHIPLDAHHLGPFGICDTTPPAPVLQSNQVRVTLINQSPTNRTHHPIFHSLNPQQNVSIQQFIILDFLDAQGNPPVDGALGRFRHCRRFTADDGQLLWCPFLR